MNKILSVIEMGKQEPGIKLLTGGYRVGTIGCFIAPTIFCHVPSDSILATREIFGPVLTIMKPYCTFNYCIII